MSRKKKYIIELTDEELAELQAISTSKTHSKRQALRATVLLRSHDGWGTSKIEKSLNVSRPAINNIQQRFLELGIEGSIFDRQRTGSTPKLTDEQADSLIATSHSTPPEGHSHWTLRLLASKVVELKFTERFSHESVRQLLKRHLQ